jgi:hypothetical protein
MRSLLRAPDALKRTRTVSLSGLGNMGQDSYKRGAAVIDEVRDPTEWTTRYWTDAPNDLAFRVTLQS